MIELKNISKTFHTTSGKVEAVKDANILINDGEIFGFIGYSGAGKSTIVRCINLLERPTTGNIIFDDIDLTELSDSDLRKKRKEIGMIFQQFNLLKSLTVFENVAFNLKNESLSKAEIKKRVEELLDLVGIPEKADSYPSQLSGGQKQRVAIARAMANNPDIILADEPTGALDSHSSQMLLSTIQSINEQLRATILMVTHDAFTASYASRILFLKDGEIFMELRKGNDSRSDFFDKILTISFKKQPPDMSFYLTARRLVPSTHYLKYSTPDSKIC